MNYSCQGLRRALDLGIGAQVRRDGRRDESVGPVGEEADQEEQEDVESGAHRAVQAVNQQLMVQRSRLSQPSRFTGSTARYRWNGEDEVAGARERTGARLVAQQAGQDAAEDAADVEQRGQIGRLLAAQSVAVVLEVSRQPVQERVVDELREEQAERVLEHALVGRTWRVRASCAL